jgi:hypothetical protein
MLQASLGAAAMLPVLWLPRKAHAGSEKIKRIEKGKRGITVWMALDKAPFPDGNSRYKDNTVAAFVPHHFRVMSDYKVDTVLHFHGHNTTVAHELKRHQLREQLAASKQNAILLAPQGPVNASDSSGGKLEKSRGYLEFLGEARRVLQLPEVSAALGKASIPGPSRIGKVCMSAHSGGYKVAAACMTRGGFHVNEVYLFDALYGDVPKYLEWIKAKRHETSANSRHKLISYYHGGRTAARNAELREALDKAGIAYLHEKKEGQLSRAEITRARVVFIKTQVDHTRLTFKYNTLRDCLFASCLQRRLKSDWFENKEESRDLDKRKRG